MAPLDFLAGIGRFGHMAALCLLLLPGAMLRPREVSRQVYEVLIGALPLGVIAGLALGVVIWLHSHRVLDQINAPQYLPEGIALAVVLELGPTGAALVAASRTGASLGAELGSMRLTEQIDALEVLGIPPMRHLVAPRVLACMVALPLLTILMVYVEIIGSYAAEAVAGRMTWQEYYLSCLSGVTVASALPAVLKTVVFGYLIGVAGCWCGLSADGGTEAVGRAATRGVVLSVLLVLTGNVLLVAAIQQATDWLKQG
jgi:phospholipid/cholesterol/gamma-HCH transport system permease protein